MKSTFEKVNQPLNFIEAIFIILAFITVSYFSVFLSLEINYTPHLVFLK